jgi:hypothetical protein
MRERSALVMFSAVVGNAREERWGGTVFVRGGGHQREAPSSIRLREALCPARLRRVFSLASQERPRSLL